MRQRVSYARSFEREKLEKAQMRVQLPVTEYIYARHYIDNKNFVLSAFQDDAYVKKSDMDGLGLCPYDPRHNSTAVFAGEYFRILYSRVKIVRHVI